MDLKCPWKQNKQCKKGYEFSVPYPRFLNKNAD